MDALTGLVARSGFLPHGYCFQWSPGLLWTMVGADLAIALAYFSLPLLILAYARQRPQLNFGGLAALFGAFILACGVTHVMDVWTIWRPDYAVQAAGKVATAIASVLTAWMAWRLLPRFVAIPSAQELSEALTRLRAESGRRHDAEDDLLEAEQSLATTLASIDAGFITTDGEGRVTRINAVAEQLTGWTAADALGRGVWQVFDRVDRPDELLGRNPVDVVAERERAGLRRQQVVCVARDGRRTPVELHAGLTRHADGRVRGVSIVFRDIGALTEAEAEVRRLAAVVECTADAIIVKTPEGRITNWNAAAERMFGYSAAEAVGQPVMMLVPPEREAEELRILDALAHGQQVPPFRTVRVTKDGRRVEISAQVSPLRDASGQVIGGVKAARDLSHQCQIETALRQSEARLRFALESASLGDWELALDSGRLHRSRRFDQCFGLAAATPLDWGREQLLDAVHAEDRDAVRQALDALADGKVAWHAEFRVVWPDASLHWLRMDARVARDDHGPACVVGIVAEVTAMRTAEQARQQAIWLEAENRRAQESSRLKSQFLANMSHELRTPLNAVIGFADLLAMGAIAPQSPRYAAALQHIGGSGRHLLQMINDVLDLSKIEAGKLTFRPETLNLPALVDELLATVAVLAEQRGLRLVSSIAPELREVHLDAARLKQVLLNYLSNAIKFTEPGGRVEVRALGEGPRRWRLEVQDSGIGIQPANLSRLFVEFQQLDDGLAKRHQGTGLGLSLTRRLVEAQGGRVGVYSRPGEGSCFYAVLPRHAALLDAEGDAAAEDDDPRLLVALRDHPWRDGLARELTHAGIDTDTAASAAELVQLARVRHYSGLALDLAWPDACGLAMLGDLRAAGASRDTPVKALGFGADASAEVTFLVSDVLAKPLDLAELDRVLAPLRPGGARGSGRFTVLVVDDEAAARDLMCAALSQVGVDAVAVDGGVAALAWLAGHAASALVLDLMMPGMDGFQVLHRLRSDPALAALPVVVWTAMSLSPEDVAQLAASAQVIAGKGEAGSLAQVRDALLRWARAGAVAQEV
ncbi:PAS domain S-box protein [Roseateles sp.]|uniref:PAS domain S-box protein n=1 Tax=Roseateles sp. TaxID=1971397 RepID=UPI003BAA58F4